MGVGGGPLGVAGSESRDGPALGPDAVGPADGAPELAVGDGLVLHEDQLTDDGDGNDNDSNNNNKNNNNSSNNSNMVGQERRARASRIMMMMMMMITTTLSTTIT